MDGDAESGEHLVILVHGIRDIARWQDEIKQTLRADGFAVESTSYGRMNLIEFLLPFPYFRNKAKLTVWTQIQHAKLLHPNASQVSVIAHSFGTYIIAQIVKEQFAFKFHRIIFCGSVVRYDFPIEHYSGRYTSPIFNDVGTADPWPAIAQSVTTGYGSVGTYGFHRTGVEDRFHNGAGRGEMGCWSGSWLEKAAAALLNYFRLPLGRHRSDWRKQPDNASRSGSSTDAGSRPKWAARHSVSAPWRNR